MKLRFFSITTKNLLLLSFILVTILTISHLIILLYHPTLKSYEFYVTGFLAILAINVFIISFQVNVKAVRIGSGILAIASLIETVLIVIFTINERGNSSYIFEVIYIIGVSIGVRGFHLHALQQKRRNKILENQNKRLNTTSVICESFYFDYDLTTTDLLLDFTQGFVNKYKLSYHQLKTTIYDFLNFVHPDNRDYIREINNKVIKDKIEAKVEYQLKLPEMKGYCWVYARSFISSENHVIGIDLDITDIKNLNKKVYETEKEIMYKDKELQLKTIEQTYILKHTTDLIAKLAPDGTVLYATESYFNIFPLTLNQLIGNNVIDINKKIGVENNEWFEDTLKPPYSSTGVSKIINKGIEKWISWKNDAVLNLDGDVEYIVVVGHDVTELTNLNDKLKYESIMDSLTGLLNRRGLYNELAVVNTKERFIAFYIDIDKFNNINDYYGHVIGDQLIMMFSNQLKIFQKLGCVVSRHSGDEFIIMKSGKLSKEDVAMLLKKISGIVENNYLVDGIKISLEASVGYVIYPEDTNDINNIISYADLAMSEAKRDKYKKCVRYNNKLSEYLNQKVYMAREIKDAIENDDFEIHYQPIVNANNNNIEYVESLIRWNHIELGWVTPGQILPVATDSGLMVKLDLYIIHKALKNFKEVIKKQHYSKAILTINVSPQTLLKDNFPEILVDMITKFDIDMNKICIEVSENTFVNNIKECNDQLYKLKQVGILVALDDFGREYSSLAILDNMEFDIIKIDRLFIDRIENEKNLEIVRMIMKISQLSSKAVIAEGVETKKQMQTLLLVGCVLQQGYFFAKPEKII